jgi:hypothetical protein
MEATSEISANRTVVVGKDSTNQNIAKHVMHRVTPIFELYYNFPFNSELAFKTFYSHIGLEFKAPYRKSDLCDWQVLKIHVNLKNIMANTCSRVQII